LLNDAFDFFDCAHGANLSHEVAPDKRENERINKHPANSGPRFA
jgi:hypothetical protein